ncbi:hypothetical protein MNBD_PLANCTO03-2451, partial [hydrothermal vent metagenome]
MMGGGGVLFVPLLPEEGVVAQATGG